jgi:hypothetical protein
MTEEQVRKSFEAERKRNPPAHVRFQRLAEHLLYLREHPDEQRAFFIRAGIWDKDGKPFPSRVDDEDTGGE